MTQHIVKPQENLRYLPYFQSAFCVNAMAVLRSTVVSSLFIFGVLAFVAGCAMGESSSKGVRTEEQCSKNCISVSQSQTSPLPSGIPQYTVEIANTCSNCKISGIHVNCGMFSSATLINPKIFRRLAYYDCLVNDGKPLNSGAIVSFRYSTTFLYPLSVSSVVCG
ncbi:hypothetical protein PHAVU_002G284400 [Phaseolus vulgaris]|uniref:Uncharacterized protein n=1 Tax=Phaseolus vulgaris TaxID=3885 RepID=V7CP55_PHAVU|nr:hypothetical protein PHAVU_002G284400g [Phaseolus vulgaris]ESW31992.1 hypothetical protein PHAVU_002G284400g [Phaseolus vulgaris]